MFPSRRRGEARGSVALCGTFGSRVGHVCHWMPKAEGMVGVLVRETKPRRQEGLWRRKGHVGGGRATGAVGWTVAWYLKDNVSDGEGRERGLLRAKR